MVWNIFFREKLKTVSTDEGSDWVLKTETKISGSWEKKHRYGQKVRFFVR